MMVAIRIDRLALSATAIAAASFVAWAIVTDQSKHIDTAAFQDAHAEADRVQAAQQGTSIPELKRKTWERCNAGAKAVEDDPTLKGGRVVMGSGSGPLDIFQFDLQQIAREACVNATLYPIELTTPIVRWARIEQWIKFALFGLLWCVGAAAFAAFAAASVAWLAIKWWPWLTKPRE